jgi:hypothetical protein
MSVLTDDLEIPSSVAISVGLYPSMILVAIWRQVACPMGVSSQGVGVVGDEGGLWSVVGAVFELPGGAAVLLAFPVDESLAECVAGPGREGDVAWREVA